MKHIRNIFNKAYAAFLLAAVAVLWGGCEKEEGGEGGEEQRFRTIEVVINSRSNAQPATRAENIASGEDDAYERHIDQYWLVVEKQGETGTGEFTVDKIIDSSSPEYRNPGTGENSETSLDVEVEIGKTYRFYALANLQGLEDGESVIKGLESLKQGDSFSDFLKSPVNVKAMSEYKVDGGSPIPMTSYYVEQSIEENTTVLKDPIQLIRLVGKVTLEVRNSTNSTIQLEKLGMGDFRTQGSIYLFPYDLATGKNTENLLATDMQDTYNPIFPDDPDEKYQATSWDVTSTSGEIATDDVKSFTAYINETRDNGIDSELKITAHVAGKDQEPKPSGFSFVRRNDWLKIPINIINAEGEITLEQNHMPIGGLPDIYKQEIENGANISLITYTTDHAGVITVNYSMQNVDGFTNPQIKHKPESFPADAKFTRVEIEENDYLLGYTDPMATGTEGNSGSFTVTVQEMSNPANITVDFTMVVTDKYNNKKELVIPYTIIIQNKEEGGN